MKLLPCPGRRDREFLQLVPLAEHDAARTQSMIDGIAGRDSTRRPDRHGLEAVACNCYAAGQLTYAQHMH